MDIGEQRLTNHMDAYLDHHNHSPQAMERVIDVLNKFDFMVTLATNRALEELPLPYTPEPVQELAKVLPFRHARNTPKHPTDFSKPTPA